jgi:hypothetical protein
MASEKAKQLARSRIKDLYKNPEYKFAVFQRSKNGLAAYFSVLHNTHESALDVARMHAATQASEGNFDAMYFVVEIKHKVGFDNGKPTDTAL